jgi:hypothetical protein
LMGSFFKAGSAIRFDGDVTVLSSLVANEMDCSR